MLRCPAHAVKSFHSDTINSLCCRLPPQDPDFSSKPLYYRKQISIHCAYVHLTCLWLQNHHHFRLWQECGCIPCHKRILYYASQWLTIRSDLFLGRSRSNHHSMSWLLNIWSSFMKRRKIFHRLLLLKTRSLSAGWLWYACSCSYYCCGAALPTFCFCRAY